MQRLKTAGYSGKVIELYANKVNVGVIENPDATYAYMGPCGDTIKLYLKISRDVIEDARFQYWGCPASAACGSVLTQVIIGKTLLEAKEINVDDVLTGLDGLPDKECHCVELVITTLHKTLSHYQRKE